MYPDQPGPDFSMLARSIPGVSTRVPSTGPRSHPPQSQVALGAALSAVSYDLAKLNRVLVDHFGSGEVGNRNIAARAKHLILFVIIIYVSRKLESKNGAHSNAHRGGRLPRQLRKRSTVVYEQSPVQ